MLCFGKIIEEAWKIIWLFPPSFLVYSISHCIISAFYIWILSRGIWCPLGIFEYVPNSSLLIFIIWQYFYFLKELVCLGGGDFPVTSLIFHLKQAAEAGALESVLKPRVWPAQVKLNKNVCGGINRGDFLQVTQTSFPSYSYCLSSLLSSDLVQAQCAL